MSYTKNNVMDTEKWIVLVSIYKAQNTYKYEKNYCRSLCTGTLRNKKILITIEISIRHPKALSQMWWDRHDTVTEREYLWIPVAYCHYGKTNEDALHNTNQDEDHREGTQVVGVICSCGTYTLNRTHSKIFYVYKQWHHINIK